MDACTRQIADARTPFLPSDSHTHSFRLNGKHLAHRHPIRCWLMLAVDQGWVVDI